MGEAMEVKVVPLPRATGQLARATLLELLAPVSDSDSSSVFVYPAASVFASQARIAASPPGGGSPVVGVSARPLPSPRAQPLFAQTKANPPGPGLISAPVGNRMPDASGGFVGASLSSAMEQSGDGLPGQRRAVSSTNHSCKSDVVAEDMNDVPYETAMHCQDADLEKTESPPHKKHAHCFKERSNLKYPEKGKGRWSAEEDEILTQMVNKHGLNSWQTIACAIPGRNALQCRSRWKYSIDPAINKEAWSEQEELRLIRAHQMYGNKWLKMVKHFPGRTNHALKEHWRGPMKRKLDSYLASGLLDQVPDLHEELPVPQSSQSDIPKGSKDLSDRNRLSSVLPTSPKPKQELKEQGENSGTSGGESSDFKYGKGFDAHSAVVSERMMAKSQQRARARRKLDFLSTPVELKTCIAKANSQKPLLKMEEMNPATSNISPSNVCQDDPPNVLSECVGTELSTAAANHPSDVHSLETPDPDPVKLCDANASDLLDMSYCDDLMIDLSCYPDGSSFI
ncbi:hypothetical protein ACP70R_029218 [Stipagrostis hirtigluma subsp. patula]